MPKTQIKIPWFSVYKNIPTERPFLRQKGESSTERVNYYVPLDIIQEGDYFFFYAVSEKSFTQAPDPATGDYIDLSTNKKIIPPVLFVTKGTTTGIIKLQRDLKIESTANLVLGGFVWHFNKNRIKLLKDYYYETGFYPRIDNVISNTNDDDFKGFSAAIIRGAKLPIFHSNRNNTRPDLGTINIQENDSLFIYGQFSNGTAIKTPPIVDPLVTSYAWDSKYALSKASPTRNYGLATATLSAGSTVIGSWQGGVTGTAISAAFEFSPSDYLTYEQDYDFATLIGSFAMASGTGIVGTALLDQVLPIQTEANDLAIYTQLNTSGTPTLPASYEQIASGSFEYDTSGTAYYSVAKKTISDPENEYIVATVPNTEATFLSVYRYWDSVGSVVVNLSTGTANRSYQAKTEDYDTSVPYTTLNVYGFTINPVQLIFSETKGFEKKTDILASNATTDGSKISGSHFTYKAYEIQTIPSTQFAYRDSIEPAGTAYSGIFPAITISVPVIGSAL